MTAVVDRPKVAAERREREELALEKLRTLGRDVSLEKVDELRVDKATEARIADLAEEYAGRREAVDGAGSDGPTKRRLRDW